MEVESILDKLNSQVRQQCYPSRIQSLRRDGLETKQIEVAVERTVAVLQRGGQSFVVYGEPQSGKTEFMTALACKLADEGHETIFVVMNDNTELETQNFDRFHGAKELNPTPVRDYQVTSLDSSRLREGKTRIIFCRKNSKRLEDLITACRFMKNRVLIDDEADYASPNTNINKKKKATAINTKVGELAQVGKDGIYIGVTATPGRLDLNNTFLNNSKEWVFMDPYPGYKGRSFFFPVTDADIANSDYILTKLPDDGDESKHLRKAILRFMLRTSLLNHPHDDGELTPYSMLIHTAGRTLDHVEDKKIVDRTLSDLSNPHSIKGKKILADLIKEARNFKLRPNDPTSEELVLHVLHNVGKHEVLIINHKEDKSNVLRASKPKALFTFAIGGNIVSRGLTFERLLTFFFSRNVKGKMQQNTYIQRARMFGNRPYSKHFELCVPKSLFENWAETFQNHELSLILAKSGEYQHVQSKGNRAADAAAIDKSNVDTITRGERPVGRIFSISEDLEKALIEDTTDALGLMRKLIASGLVPTEAFSAGILNYIELTSKTPADVAIVKRLPRTGPAFIQDISRYADGNEATILRARGGVIDALINKEPRYYNKLHYILPIRNKDGEIRFLYRNKLGHTILENFLKKQKQI